MQAGDISPHPDTGSAAGAAPFPYTTLPPKTPRRLSPKPAATTGVVDKKKKDENSTFLLQLLFLFEFSSFSARLPLPPLPRANFKEDK